MLAQNAFSYPGIGISGLKKKNSSKLKTVWSMYTQNKSFQFIDGERMAAQRTNLKIKKRAHVKRAKLLFSSFLTMKICEVLVTVNLVVAAPICQIKK